MLNKKYFFVKAKFGGVINLGGDNSGGTGTAGDMDLGQRYFFLKKNI